MIKGPQRGERLAKKVTKCDIRGGFKANFDDTPFKNHIINFPIHIDLELTFTIFQDLSNVR